MKGEKNQEVLCAPHQPWTWRWIPLPEARLRPAGAAGARGALGGARWVCVCAAATLAPREKPGGALRARVSRPVALRPGAHTRPRPPSLALRLPRSAHPQAERPPAPLFVSPPPAAPRQSRLPGVGGGDAPLAGHLLGDARLGLPAPELGGRQRPRCPGCGPGADGRAPPTPRPILPRLLRPPGSELHTHLSWWLAQGHTGQGVRSSAATLHTRAREALVSPSRCSSSFMDFLAFLFHLLCSPAARPLRDQNQCSLFHHGELGQGHMAPEDGPRSIFPQKKFLG